MTSKKTAISVEPAGIYTIVGPASTDTECSESLEAQIDYVLSKFASFTRVLNTFIFHNVDNITNHGLEYFSLQAITNLEASKEDFEELTHQLVARINEEIPFEIVEVVSRDDVRPKPAVLTRYNDDHPFATNIPQESANQNISDIEETWSMEAKKTDATAVIRPFRMQFTPTASISGGSLEEAVDVALEAEFLSADSHTHRLIPPSEFMSETLVRPSTSKWATLATVTDTEIKLETAASTAVPPPEGTSSMIVITSSKTTSKDKSATENQVTGISGSISRGSPQNANPPPLASESSGSTETTQNARSSRTSNERSGRAPLQRKKRLELPLAMSFPSDPRAQFPRPFNQHEIPPAPGSRPGQLKRSGGFYHKTHPNIFWTDEWGPKPSLDEQVTFEDLVPSWTWESLQVFDQDLRKEHDSESESDRDPSPSPPPSTKKDKGKGKAKALKDEPRHGPGIPADDVPASAPSKLRSRKEGSSAGRGSLVVRKAAGGSGSTSGTWTGITKTLRSVAAAVSGAIKEPGSREGLRSASASSSNSGPQTRGNKKRRRERDDDEDGGDDQAHTSRAKKPKRTGKR